VCGKIRSEITMKKRNSNSKDALEVRVLKCHPIYLLTITTMNSKGQKV
jgi:hypothetical protein